LAGAPRQGQKGLERCGATLPKSKAKVKIFSATRQLSPANLLFVAFIVPLKRESDDDHAEFAGFFSLYNQVKTG
jgi:hypothetical protein